MQKALAELLKKAMIKSKKYFNNDDRGNIERTLNLDFSNMFEK